MKKNHTIKTVIAVTSILLFAACTGNKKEAENKSEGVAVEQPKSSEKVKEIKTFDNVDASVKEQINVFIADYFALNKSLIEDNQDGAKAAARKLQETVRKFDMSKLSDDQMGFYHEQLAKLNQGLNGIHTSSDIEETRSELSTLSGAIYSLVKAYHPNQTELYYQYCPMAMNGEGANWISSTKEIVNPYMGQRMLKCGTTKEIL